MFLLCAQSLVYVTYIFEKMYILAEDMYVYIYYIDYAASLLKFQLSSHDKRLAGHTSSRVFTLYLARGSL